MARVPKWDGWCVLCDKPWTGGRFDVKVSKHNGRWVHTACKADEVATLNGPVTELPLERQWVPKQSIKPKGPRAADRPAWVHRDGRDSRGRFTKESD